MWQQSSLTWSEQANSIQSQAETITDQTGATDNTAVSRLTALQDDANYGRHPLSADAGELLSLRRDLDALLATGTILSATPYQFQVGHSVKGQAYLNPKKAVGTLVKKLNDLADANRPTGQIHVIGIMLTAPTLKTFVERLQQVTAVMSLPEWCRVTRQATGLLTLEKDKLRQPSAIVQPRFQPTAALHPNPLGDYLAYQGAQIAALESLASDATDVIGKLQQLATKRQSKMNQIRQSINALKTLNANVWSSANVWSCQISGSLVSVASQLSDAVVPNHEQYTIASLVISNQPMPFFEALL
jgi:hypothetical protein